MDSSLNISILNFCYSSNPKMAEVNRGDIQKLFNAKADYSRSVAEQVKTIMNVSFRYTVTKKVIANNLEEEQRFKQELLELVLDVSEYLPDIV